MSNVIVNYHIGTLYRPYTAPSGPPTNNMLGRLVYGQSMTTSGSNITAWGDISGNSHNGTPSGTVTDNTTSVRFSEASGGRMDLSGLTNPNQITIPYTIYLVAEFSVANGFYGVLAGDPVSSNLGWFIQNSGGTRNLGIQGSSGFFLDSVTLSDNTYYVLKMTVNGASSAIKVNNNTATTGTLGSGQPGTLCIGYSFTAGGTGYVDVKEAIIYTGTGDDAAMDTYMFATYGIHCN